MNRKGFSLIELVISMGILAIVMGGLVQLFGTSVMAQITGFNQQDMYAQARQVENELKTTLRYSTDNRSGAPSVRFYDTDNKEITAEDETSSANSLSYTSVIYDNAAGKNKYHDISVSWVGDEKKQIQIVKKSYFQDAKDNPTESTIVFPKNIENSAFDDESIKVDDKIPFPVTLISNDSDIHNKMLAIKLPYKYKANRNDSKTNVLETSVMLKEINIDFPGLMQAGGAVTVDDGATIQGDIYGASSNRNMYKGTYGGDLISAYADGATFADENSPERTMANINLSDTPMFIQLNTFDPNVTYEINGASGQKLGIFFPGDAYNLSCNIKGPDTNAKPMILTIDSNGRTVKLNGYISGNVVILANCDLIVDSEVSGNALIVTSGALNCTGKIDKAILVSMQNVVLDGREKAFTGAIMSRGSITANYKSFTYNTTGVLGMLTEECALGNFVKCL